MVAYIVKVYCISIVFLASCHLYTKLGEWVTFTVAENSSNEQVVQMCLFFKNDNEERSKKETKLRRQHNDNQFSKSAHFSD